MEQVEFCDQIKPGKKNASIYGCIGLKGHKGPHVNGRNEGWIKPAAAPETKPGGAMSEQQVLPELEITAEDCREQAENPKPAVATLRCRERQLLTALTSLAQSEAERGRLMITVNAVAGGAAQGLMLHSKITNAYEKGRRDERLIWEEKGADLEDDGSEMFAEGESF
jgi:hypothetical protein